MLNRNYFTNHDVHRLEEKAVELRQDILDMIYRAGAGHPGGLSVCHTIIKQSLCTKTPLTTPFAKILTRPCSGRSSAGIDRRKKVKLKKRRSVSCESLVRRPSVFFHKSRAGERGKFLFTETDKYLAGRMWLC